MVMVETMVAVEDDVYRVVKFEDAPAAVVDAGTA
jgi:hypothetical protein